MAKIDFNVQREGRTLHATIDLDAGVNGTIRVLDGDHHTLVSRDCYGFELDLAKMVAELRATKHESYKKGRRDGERSEHDFPRSKDWTGS